MPMSGAAVRAAVILQVAMLADVHAEVPGQPAPRTEARSALPNFDPVPPPDFLVRVREIADWIVRNSDYEGYERIPAFVVLPRSTLNYIVFSQTPDGYRGQASIQALYAPNLILISDELELESGEHAHTLVHELVHHLQFETGKAFRCTLEAEREAYQMQRRWVEETGTGDLPSLLFIMRLKCDNPHDGVR